MSKDNLEEMARKLCTYMYIIQYMEEKGCNTYLLIEYTEVLHINNLIMACSREINECVLHLKVLEKAKQPVSKDNLEEMARKLQYMEDKGCKSYQLMEYPEVLLLTEEEIIARVECLEKMNVNPIR